MRYNYSCAFITQQHCISSTEKHPTLQLIQEDQKIYWCRPPVNVWIWLKSFSQSITWPRCNHWFMHSIQIYLNPLHTGNVITHSLPMFRSKQLGAQPPATRLPPLWSHFPANISTFVFEVVYSRPAFIQWNLHVILTPTKQPFCFFPFVRSHLQFSHQEQFGVQRLAQGQRWRVDYRKAKKN